MLLGKPFAAVRVTRRLVALALAVAAACYSCSRAGQQIAPAHVLRIADGSDPSSLNPLLAVDQDTMGFDLLFAQTLVGLSAGNRLVPILVSRVPSRTNGDISRDGRTIIYHLRRNVRFADGRPLTSADVSFTFRAIIDPRNPVLGADAYRHIAALTAPNASTIVVRLRSPWNAAVRELFAESDFAFGILPSHAFKSTVMENASWEEHAFGTGPFRVLEWKRGDRVLLTPNPYFSPRPKLERIELRMIPDPNAALGAERTGAIDLARITTDQVGEASSVRTLRVAATDINGVDYIALQSSTAPTDDLHVRRAIAYALDVSLIERARHRLLARAASFLPPTFAWHDSRLALIDRNEAEAAAELDRAGWHLTHGVREKEGVPLELQLVRGIGASVKSSLIVQRQLAAAGISATIKAFPPAAFDGPDGPLRTGRFNLAFVMWIGGADPEQSVFFACSQIGPNGNNTQRFCDPAFDAKFRDQADTSSELRRHKDFLIMQRIIYDRLPILPLDYIRFFDVTSARVTGFARNMLGFPVGAESWDTK